MKWASWPFYLQNRDTSRKLNYSKDGHFQTQGSEHSLTVLSVCQAHTDIRDKQHVTAQKELWAEKAGDKFPFLLNIQFGSTSKCHWGKALRSYIFKYAEVRLRSMQESGHNINWLKFYFEADSTCGNSTICHYVWMGTEILGKEMGEDLCPV